MVQQIVACKYSKQTAKQLQISHKTGGSSPSATHLEAAHKHSVAALNAAHTLVVLLMLLLALSLNGQRVVFVNGDLQAGAACSQYTRQPLLLLLMGQHIVNTDLLQAPCWHSVGAMGPCHVSVAQARSRGEQWKQHASKDAAVSARTLCSCITALPTSQDCHQQPQGYNRLLHQHTSWP